ncbi:E3 ubiquitin-protein ligase RBBP6 isoform X2 [Episyrphus balteatus]|uniref:E3 ubiquitin-protein ligase RBBP6 isoform X2 n=1 Tax=Episyrphus balteatus TaxID=286459 RepID=UPI0024867474|nr:E3 ubiquitin-protein ligase RBBP6 isoform X2 [Episyrphus balteatus]
MSVHYKFKSSLDFDTITFDGLHISVNDFRKAVVQQKRLGKTNDFELQITNAQTKEEYQNDNDLIPKNTSLIISRIPQISKKSRDTSSSSQPQNTPVVSHVPKFDSNTLDLSQMNASEEDKIQAMMAQSTVDYDPRGEAIAEEIVVPEKQPEVPDELLCSICKDIFRDAVMIPCCGSSFCDDCVRTALLESEENECPDCKEKGTSPGSLIPNRFLRSSVNTFKNETGYERRRKNNGVHEGVSNPVETKEEPTPNENENEIEKKPEIVVEETDNISSNEDDMEKREDDNLTPPKPSPEREESLSPKKEETRRLHSEEKEEENRIEPTIEPMSPKMRVEVVQTQHEILPNSDPHQLEEELFKQHQSSYSNYGQPVPDLPHRSNTSDQYPVRSDSYMRHTKHNPGIVQPNMGYCNNYGNRTERYYYPRDSYNINAAPYPYVQNPRCRQMAPHTNIQPYYQGMSGPIPTGIIEDPLEAFNRIMKEKEKRKEMKRLAAERAERHRPQTMNKRGPRDPSPLAEKRIRHRASPVNERRNRSPLRQEKPSSHRNIEREKPIRSHRNHYPGNHRSFSRSNSPPQRRFSKSPIRRRSRTRSPHPRSHSREMEPLRHDNRHPRNVLQQSHRIDHEKDMMRYNKRPQQGQGRFSETRSLSEIGPKENRRHNSKTRENGNQMFDNYGPSSSSSRKMFFETEIPENREVQQYEFHNERRSKVSMSKFEDGPRSERTDKRSRENHDERRHIVQSPDEEPPKQESDKKSKERKKKKEKDEKSDKKSKKDKKEKRKRHKDETKKHTEHKKSRRDTDSNANANEKGSDEGRSRPTKKDNSKGSNDESFDDKAETFTPDININRNLQDDQIVEDVQITIRKEIKNPFKTQKSPPVYRTADRCKQIMDNNGSGLNTPTSFIDTTPENYAGKWDNFDFSMPNSEDVRGDNDRDCEYNSHMFQNSSPSLRNEQFEENRHVSRKKDSRSRSHQREERKHKNEEAVKENRSDLAAAAAKSTSRRPSPTPSEAASSSSSKTPQSKKRRKKSKHKKEKSSKRSSSAESSRKSSSKHKKSRTDKKKKSKRNESR